MGTDASDRKFGEYHLVERIAVGGMAEVWKARAYGLAGFEKTLVIKKILADLTRDEEFVRLFIDEARIAVLLQHHNIVQVFDLGTAEGTLYMAMEYVQGTDLSRLVKRVQEREPFPVPLALFIASEILKALRFAHDRKDDDGRNLGIVHCDISPHNVLISHAGEVKITDFGISRAAFQAATMHDTVRGKYAYMSPEQIENKPLEARSDLFSLGIVLWEVLTGRRLFKAKTKEETLTRVKRAEVPSPRLYRPQISEGLESIVLKALARQPEQRFASAGEMLDALGMLMIREGHRATNNDLAAYLQIIGPEGADRKVPRVRSMPETLVVVSMEASPEDPTRPEDEVARLVEGWADELVRAGAQIWERERTSLLGVWTVEEDLSKTLPHVVGAVAELGEIGRAAGCRLAIGVAPGRARIYEDTRRPGRNWELSGPFYLARWMMNLSAHRGRLVITKVGAEHAKAASVERLGKVAIEDGRYIELFEVS
ncbi:MAG: serine/threonine protein kinase [Alphaproteobacteria bacterium]|nr:serine/threonine protein kinase [Alphaproteobacteria bacterium]